jgi:hypothetical protein
MARQAQIKTHVARGGARSTPARPEPREIVLGEMTMTTDLPEIFPILTDEFQLLEAYFTDLLDKALRPRNDR